MSGLRARIVRHVAIDTRRLSRSLGALIRDHIRSRTLAGRDIDGTPFAPHRGERAGEPVDLVDRGAMLPSLRVDVKQKARGLRILIGPTGPHARKALFLHYGTRYMPPRPWLGVSDQDLEELVAGAMSSPGVLAYKSGPSR